MEHKVKVLMNGEVVRTEYACSISNAAVAAVKNGDYIEVFVSGCL